MSWGTFGKGDEAIDSYETESSADPGKKAGAAKQAGNQDLKPAIKGPMAIYFCSEQLAQTAGIGSEAIRAKIKAGVKPLKDTIFESSSVLEAFKKAGIDDFFKVPATQENLEVARKYKVTQDNTLVLCAPDGELVTALAGMQCSQSNVLKLLKAWPEIYAEWKKKKKNGR